MQQTRPRRLTRSHDRMLGGVAGGIAAYFDVDPTVVRVLIVIATFVSGGAVLLAYPIMWLLMPAPGSEAPSIGGEPSPVASAADARDRTALLFGAALIALGGFLLLSEVVDLSRWLVFQLWPLVLIAAGAYLIFRRRG